MKSTPASSQAPEAVRGWAWEVQHAGNDPCIIASEMSLT